MSSVFDPETDQPLADLRKELADHWGAEFSRIRLFLCSLGDSHWHTPDDLIAHTTLSHRTVSDLLQRLGPWVEMRNDRWRILPRYTESFVTAFQCSSRPSSVPDLYDALVDSRHDAITSMNQVQANRPRPAKRLDQVAATARTAMKRAIFLTENYDLSTASLLFLGDHDLTSLALMIMAPHLEASVIDLDDDVLDYIWSNAQQHGWTLTPLFADLRVELPRSATDRFDLVFTDPPYSPSGVRLFLARAVAALRDNSFTRILFAYGFGEQLPALGLAIQDQLHDLHLVAEAILPRFSQYERAQAIGRRSSLYVCRPTRRTAPAARAAVTDEARIYSHGRNAEEAHPHELPDPTVGLVRDLLDAADDAISLVGSGWPSAFLPHAQRLRFADFLRDMHRPSGKPPFTRSPHTGTVIVNLYPEHPEYVVRVFLSAAASRIIVVVDGSAVHANQLLNEDSDLRRLIGTKYTLRFGKSAPRGQPVVLTGELVTHSPGRDADYVTRYIIDHRHAALANAWREGLISLFGDKQRTIAKNDARRVIERSRLGAGRHRLYLSELPRAALALLYSEVQRSIIDLTAGASA